MFTASCSHSHYLNSCAVLALIFLSSCTTAPASVQNVSATPTVPPKLAAPISDVSDNKIHLKFYMRWDKARIESSINPIIAAFEKENPTIKIDLDNISSGSNEEYWTKLKKRIGTDNMPDILYPATHHAYSLASSGVLLDLMPFIQESHLDLAAYDPEIMSLYQKDAVTYALPLDFAALAVYINKDMFDEAHIPYPTAGWTWDDFLKIAQTLTKDHDGDGHIDQFGIDISTSFWPVIVKSKTGHGVFDNLRKPTRWLLDEPDAVDALQWFADLSNKYKVMPSADERANIADIFGSGKAGMQIIGPGRIPQYMSKIKNFKWDLAPLPVGKVSANRSDGSGFAISAKSQHPKEAWKFIQYLAGPGSPGVGILMDTQQVAPALLELQNSDQFLKPAKFAKVNKAAFLAGKSHRFSMYDPIHPVYEQVVELESSEFNNVWNGKTTAADAVKRLQPKIAKILSGLK